MCLDFGGQNHITKAVIKSTQLLSYTRSVSSHDLGTELLKCVLCISVCPEKLGDETQNLSKLAFQMQDLTLEVSLRHLEILAWCLEPVSECHTDRGQQRLMIIAARTARFMPIKTWEEITKSWEHSMC